MEKVKELLLGNEYSPKNAKLSDLKNIYDSGVTTCLINLYFCLARESEMMYEEFAKSYNTLDTGQRNYVRNEYLLLIQNKNEELVMQRHKL